MAQVTMTYEFAGEKEIITRDYPSSKAAMEAILRTLNKVAAQQHGPDTLGERLTIEFVS